MKKILFLVLGILCMLTIIETASAQQRFLGKKKKPTAESFRGKANAKELGKEVHEALQNGRTAKLVTFAPSNRELKDIYSSTPSDETAKVIEQLNEDQLEKTWENDLSILKNQLSAEGINPATATIVSVKAGRAKPKTPEIVPVTMQLTSASQDTVAITFDAVKYQKRLFLLHNLAVKKEMQAVNMKE